MSSVREIPVVFACEGSTLVGVVHLPAQVRTRGMLSVVAGGPQYRGGVCRLQVQMARRLAQEGTPVMRFDYRGLGDSEGEFRGFRDIEADLRSALEAFAATVPGLQEVVLWGGCDAASAITINAWKFPQVSGIVLGNPWVHSQATAATVEMQHYGRRWKDPAFWRKVLRGQYNPLPALRTIGFGLLARTGLAVGGPRSSMRGKSDDTSAPYLDRMRHGLARFRGDVLLLMSGRSLFSREFDVLVAGNAVWQQALATVRHRARHDIPDADQAFSTLAAREEITAVTARWLHDVHSVGNQGPAT
jgi:exosortase A-associated hydrolase 1